MIWNSMFYMQCWWHKQKQKWSELCQMFIDLETRSQGMFHSKKQEVMVRIKTNNLKCMINCKKRRKRRRRQSVHETSLPSVLRLASWWNLNDMIIGPSDGPWSFYQLAMGREKRARVVHAFSQKENSRLNSCTRFEWRESTHVSDLLSSFTFGSQQKVFQNFFPNKETAGLILVK